MKVYSKVQHTEYFGRHGDVEICLLACGKLGEPETTITRF